MTLYARVLVEVIVGGFGHADAIELPIGATLERSYKPLRSGLARVRLTQMGNVPVVLTSVAHGAMLYLQGPALSFEFSDATAGFPIILQFAAWRWESNHEDESKRTKSTRGAIGRARDAIHWLLTGQPMF